MITLPAILAKTAKKHPNRSAVVINNEEITYAELYQKSLALAKSIVSIGINKGDRIGFLFHKSIESVISIYGIMLSGGCYVPLDIKSPKDRIKAIVRDCDIKILITSKTIKELEFLDQTGLVTVITTKENSAQSKIQSVQWLTVIRSLNKKIILPEDNENDVSYILYTSGSTGVPKGIVHSHKSACSFALWGALEFGLTKNDVVSNHAPYHFDLSTFDLFASCLVGAKMVIIPELLTKFPASIVKLIVSEKISVWYSVPSAIVQMLQRGTLDITKTKSLRVILFAGEEFPIQSLQALRNVIKDTILTNLYGPTETNVCTFSKYMTKIEICSY